VRSFLATIIANGRNKRRVESLQPGHLIEDDAQLRFIDDEALSPIQESLLRRQRAI